MSEEKHHWLHWPHPELPQIGDAIDGGDLGKMFVIAIKTNRLRGRILLFVAVESYRQI